MNYKVKCYLGVRFPEHLSDKEWKELYNDIENMSSFYKIKMEGKFLVNKVRFRFLKSSRELNQIKKNIGVDKTLLLIIDKFLIIDFEISSEILVKNKIDISTLLEKRIADLIVALSIARKGGLEVAGKSLLFVNGQFYSFLGHLIHGIERAAIRSKEIKWPKLNNISLQKTITWLDNFQEEMDGISTTKIGRALNAYSYLFKRQGGEGSAAELFWCLVGLEALYVEGNSSLQSQVNLKSQIFLGQRKENKKVFNEMYDFRSRFIHGDLNFTNNFIINDKTEDYTKHIFNIDDNESLAIAILIATFQKLIQKNSTSLEFDYKLKNNR